MVEIVEFGRGICFACHGALSWGQRKIIYEGNIFHFDCLAKKLRRLVAELEQHIEAVSLPKGIQHCFRFKEGYNPS